MYISKNSPEGLLHPYRMHLFLSTIYEGWNNSRAKQNEMMTAGNCTPFIISINYVTLFIRGTAVVYSTLKKKK